MMTTLEANTKYVNLINHYKMFPPKDGEYFEVHHIVPRAISPELINDKTNLVKLPYHAHVLAHLYYAYSLEDGDKHKFGQINAVIHMLSVKNKKQHISEEFILEHAEELDAARAKFRELDRIANIGKHHSDETKRKISEANKGQKRSDASKQKMSEAMKGKSKGKPSPNKGKKFSDDTKKKLSEAHKGKKHSDDAKQKISEAMKGKNKGKNKGKHWYHNPETNEANRFFKCPKGWLPGRK